MSIISRTWSAWLAGFSTGADFGSIAARTFHFRCVPALARSTRASNCRISDRYSSSRTWSAVPTSARNRLASPNTRSSSNLSACAAFAAGAVDALKSRSKTARGLISRASGVVESLQAMCEPYTRV